MENAFNMHSVHNTCTLTKKKKNKIELKPIITKTTMRDLSESLSYKIQIQKEISQAAVNGYW